MVVLAGKTTSDPTLRFLLASLIMGLLSSLAKLLEYKTISHELQLVIGTPVCLVFRYARKLLALILRCSGVSDPSASLQWLDPQWILKISRIARDDPAMHVMRNFSRVLEKQPSDAPPDVLKLGLRELPVRVLGPSEMADLVSSLSSNCLREFMLVLRR